MANNKKSVNSKEMKASIRKDGFKQAASAVKQMAKPIAKEVLKGVATGKKAGGIAVDVIRSTLDDGTLQDLASGIIKGIFNDDNDYVFNGYKPEVAVNATRPMDIYSLREYLDNMAEGGVPYVSRLNLAVKIAALDDAFTISATKLYGEIRGQLRSNLPYGSATVKSYLQLSVLLTVLIAQFKRNLAFASATNGVDVKFNDTINAIPDPFEQTFVPAIRPDWNNPSSTIWASNKNLLIKANTILEQLYVPHKYYNWINWYFNTAFVDDSSLHRQIYLNDVREMDSFKINKYTDKAPFGVSDVDIILDGVFDPLMDNNPLERIMNIAQTLLDNYAMVIKDIMNKTDIGKNFKQLTIAPETRKLNDPSYFQYLINSYSMGSAINTYSTALHDAPFNVYNYYDGRANFGYIRYDELPNTPKDKLGPIQGLAAIAARSPSINPDSQLGIGVPYKPNCLILPISQSCVVYIAEGMGILANNTSDIKNGSLPVALEDQVYAASIRSFIDHHDVEVTEITSGEATTVRGTPVKRIDPSLPNLDLGSINLFNDWMSFTVRAQVSETSMTLSSTATYSTTVAEVRGAVNSRIGFKVTLPSGTHIEASGTMSAAGLCKYYNEFNITSEWPIVTEQQLAYTAKKVASTGSVTGLYDITFYAPYSAGSTVSLESNELKSVFLAVPGTTVTYIGATVPTFWDMQYRAVNTNTVYTTHMELDVAQFIANKFDYHIPVYFSKPIYNGLIKETYRPVLLELDNVSNTLELMMLGLVSII